jgi:hypothetical protein
MKFHAQMESLLQKTSHAYSLDASAQRKAQICSKSNLQALSGLERSAFIHIHDVTIKSTYIYIQRNYLHVPVNTSLPKTFKDKTFVPC